MANRGEKTFSFEVDDSSDLPLWVQLKNRIAFLISSGFYEPGDQLPTVRALASDISINYNTVNKAYLALKSEGFIESTRGRGAFVRGLDAEVDEAISEDLDIVLGDCIAACREMGLSIDDVCTCMIAKARRMKQEETGQANDVSAGQFVTIRLGASSRRKHA